jgi:pimeloyl-ACP methyl ester carboxylesterase
VMEGAAHLPGLEQPAAFAALLRDFLGRPAA